MNQTKVLVRIAQKIRSTRLAKSLTIQQLALKSQVSKGLLSKVENARTIPSLPVLINIIQCLDISLQEFFADLLLLSEKNYIILKRSQFAAFQREERQGFLYEHILSQPLRNCTLEAVLLTIEPGAKSIPTTTDGYEFKYVISGSCDYMIDEDRLTLEEGDALYFDASLPHVPINSTNAKAVLLALYFLFPRT